MARGFEVSLFGRWNFATLALVGAAGRIKRASDRAVMQEAQYLRKKIVQGMRTQAPGGVAFKPLEPQTIARRKRDGFTGSKALIRTGDMRNAIKVSKVGAQGVFVGILRSARGGGGESLVNLAAIHEFGAPRAKIPARPFMQPVFEAERATIQKRFVQNMARNLGGVFGQAVGG